MANGHEPEVAPPGKALPGREAGAQPLTPGAGLDAGANDARNAGEPAARNAREPKAPAIGAGIVPPDPEGAEQAPGDTMPPFRDQ